MAPRTATASAFRVTPIRVDLNARAATALMTIVNESTEELRFEITGFEWAQADGTGEMKLAPTKDIVFFPALLSVKAGEERKVRVGTTQTSGPVEKTYRIFFEELPPLQTPSTAGRAEVRIVTKIGVPIFIEPAKTTFKGEVANTKVAVGKLEFDVNNGGNVHFRALAVKVAGQDSKGTTVFEKHREGGYVLSGQSRHYTLELSPAECAGLRSVKVAVDTDGVVPKGDDSTLKQEFAVPATGSCH